MTRTPYCSAAQKDKAALALIAVVGACDTATKAEAKIPVIHKIAADFLQSPASEDVGRVCLLAVSGIFDLTKFAVTPKLADPEGLVGRLRERATTALAQAFPGPRTQRETLIESIQAQIDALKTPEMTDKFVRHLTQGTRQFLLAVEEELTPLVVVQVKSTTWAMALGWLMDEEVSDTDVYKRAEEALHRACYQFTSPNASPLQPLILRETHRAWCEVVSYMEALKG